MSGNLKAENFECLNDWVQLQDMVISVGTSMVGMGSDRIAVEAMKKHNKGMGQGLVIINNQET